MKILMVLALFVLLGVPTYAQQAAQERILAEAAAMSGKIVKGAPFSADAVNESIQVLADGNRIVRSTTNKLYRNSEGRFRRDMSGGSGGPLATYYNITPGVTILDPVAGQKYLLDSELRTARVGKLGSGSGGAVAVLPSMSPDRAAEVEAKLRAELMAAGEVPVAPSPPRPPTAVLAEELAAKERSLSVISSSGGFAYVTGPVSKYESRVEDLGTQNIEGVEAVGKRTVTTIPAGAIGNERPIEIVYERWFSNELQLVVFSRHTDPRFGEQTYRLTNIVRSEPDPSLFELPSGYRLLTQPPKAFTIESPKGSGQRAVTVKPSASVRTVSTTQTKP
ncbi:MAG: hypothetical protein IPM25_19515 [Chloracidobacterium sp.]|nr:hypothetical protein [Chloracidobacterium sp.]